MTMHSPHHDHLKPAVPGNAGIAWTALKSRGIRDILPNGANNGCVKFRLVPSAQIPPS